MIASCNVGLITGLTVTIFVSAAHSVRATIAGEPAIARPRCGVRPGFDDNMPALVRDDDGIWHANGMFRHGFLLSPWLGAQAVAALD